MGIPAAESPEPQLIIDVAENGIDIITKINTLKDDLKQYKTAVTKVIIPTIVTPIRDS